MEIALTQAEQNAVERHRCRLAKQRGEDISLDSALCDWMENHSSTWRMHRHTLALEKQREEINKHKWILSERACHDVGREAAMDWISNYAAQWRDWFDSQEWDEKTALSTK